MPTVLALDLCAAVSVHAFVAAEIRELGVGLVAYLTCRDMETDVEHVSIQDTLTHPHILPEKNYIQKLHCIT